MFIHADQWTKDGGDQLSVRAQETQVQACSPSVNPWDHPAGKLHGHLPGCVYCRGGAAQTCGQLQVGTSHAALQDNTYVAKDVLVCWGRLKDFQIVCDFSHSSTCFEYFMYNTVQDSILSELFIKKVL